MIKAPAKYVLALILVASINDNTVILFENKEDLSSPFHSVTPNTCVEIVSCPGPCD